MTKKEMGEKARELLYSVDHGETVDSEFLRFLFQSHPEYEQKRGLGIERIFVGKPPNRYPGRCFYLQRVDGTITDISFLECIRASTPATKFRSACRTVIAPQIKRFRESSPYVCAVCGKEMQPSMSHVDHHPISFESIVQLFLKEKGITPTNAMFTLTRDNSAGDYFVEKALADSFAEFHHDRAMLRITCAFCNLTKKRL